MRTFAIALALLASTAAAPAEELVYGTLAHTEFCERYQSECAVDPNEPAVVHYTPELIAKADLVNRAVNARIEAKTDFDHWGVGDRWDFAEDGLGDCEDYQLVKRRELRYEGVPHRALRMVIVHNPKDNAGHLVMALMTDAGPFILDSEHDRVEHIHSIAGRYQFQRRESSDTPGGWVKWEW